MVKNVKTMVESLSVRDRNKLKSRKLAISFMKKLMKDAHSNFIASKKTHLEIIGISPNQKRVDVILKILNSLCKYGFCYKLCRWSKSRMLLKMVNKKDKHLILNNNIACIGTFIIDDTYDYEKKSQEELKTEYDYFSNITVKEPKNTIIRWGSNDICGKMLEDK